MYQGRYTKPAPVPQKPAHRRKLNKWFLVTLSLILLLGIAGGSTLAFIIAGGGAVENSFTPGVVACEVGADYKVENTGNTDAYIRAAVIINWMSTSEDDVINGIAPAAGTNYTLTPGDDWTRNDADGYYYYSGKLTPGSKTTPVCAVTDIKDVPAGFELVVEVLAEAIQADGDLDSNAATKPIADAWGVAAPQG